MLLLIDSYISHNQHIAVVQTAKPEKAINLILLSLRGTAHHICAPGPYEHAGTVATEKLRFKTSINNPEAGTVPLRNGDYLWRQHSHGF
jgi:hypothetical protein